MTESSNKHRTVVAVWCLTVVTILLLSAVVVWKPECQRILHEKLIDSVACAGTITFLRTLDTLVRRRWLCERSFVCWVCFAGAVLWREVKAGVASAFLFAAVIGFIVCVMCVK